MHRYLIALGSNVRHPRHGAPREVLRAAARALDSAGMDLEALSPIIASAPLGPSRRRYANACALVSSPLAPAALLSRLQSIEHTFGRVRRGAPGAPARSISTSCCGRAAHWQTSKPTSSSPTRPTARAPSYSAPPRLSPPTGATHSQVWPQNTWLPA
jgi:2-amino-4-hydroxy-6-hydroxymethyldihydropteridine diphosphokinase